MRTETRGLMKKEGKLTDSCTHSYRVGVGGEDEDEERVDEAARGTAGYGLVWRKLLHSEKGSSSR